MSYSEFDAHSYTPEGALHNTPITAKRKRNPLVTLLLLIVILGVAVVGFSVGVQLTWKTFEGCLINDKVSSDGEMRVFSENCGTLKVETDPFIGPSSTQEVFDSIVPGDVYTMKVTGIQVDALSLLPNIMSVEKVGSTNEAPGE